jgi:hypothetical protein
MSLSRSDGQGPVHDALPLAPLGPASTQPGPGNGAEAQIVLRGVSWP